ncbi:MAG: tetratricopeptide repeat protein [Myxococcota bacterium]
MEFFPASPDQLPEEEVDTLSFPDIPVRHTPSSDEPQQTQILERGELLSRCMLWKLQEEYYQQQGISAWDAVPFYPTSNAFIGDQYAAVAIAWLLDVRVQLDPSQPVYIVELAAGTGCFSFYVLKALEEKLVDFPSLRKLKLRYIMTDFADSNVRTWRRRQELEPFVSSGLLDFAVYRPEDERAFILRVSGEVVSRETLVNPMLVFANYFFDSLRQDIYRVEQGQLLQGRVTLYRYLKGVPPSIPVEFEQLKVREDYAPLTAATGDDPLFDQILQSYVPEAPIQSLLFPLGALKCLRNLQLLSRARLTLLTSDKGFTHASYQHGYAKHSFAVHGSFSFMVNYDAIRRFFEQQGGMSLLTSDPHLVLSGGLFALSSQPLSLELTRATFRDRMIQHNHMSDLFHLHALLREMTSSEDIVRGLLAALRLSTFDPMSLESCAPRLYDQVREIDAKQREQLLTLLVHIRERIYPIRQQHYRSLYWIGKLYYGLSLYDEAIAIFEEAIQRVNAEDSNTYYYMAACYEMKDQEQQALEYYLVAQAFEPDCKTTSGAIARVQRHLEKQGVEQRENPAELEADPIQVRPSPELEALFHSALAQEARAQGVHETAVSHDETSA